ncbi:MAG: hypothetical protein RJA22_1255 [Verrucomicrobiota bacterium]|jgi:hypothetical protein
MRLTLAGVRRGRRVVIWSNVARLAVMVVPIPALITGLVHRLARHDWSLNSFLLGLAAGFVVVLLVVVGALCTELRKMPIIPDAPPAPPKEPQG